VAIVVRAVDLEAWVDGFFNEEGRKAGRKRGMKKDGGFYGIPAFLLSLFKSFRSPRCSVAIVVRAVDLVVWVDGFF
jgi:hypothetical protein